MKAVICGFARSPFCSAAGGMLAGVRPDTLAALVGSELLGRLSLDPPLIEEVIVGCAHPHAQQGGNVARAIGLLCGLPQGVAGVTISKQGGSSMHAVHTAAAQIDAGMGDAFLCIGVECASLVPAPPPGFEHPRLALASSVYLDATQGTATIATRWRISQERQDSYAAHAHACTRRAALAGAFAEEIVPVAGESGTLIDRDELPSCPALTAAMGDGACALLVASDTFASRHGIIPLARIRAFASIGVDPAVMGMGAVAATRKALRRAGLGGAEVSVIELHENSAAQIIACAQDLGFTTDGINAHGGALSLSDPAGASGARVTGKAAALLAASQGRFAIAALSISGGQGIATVLERV